LDPERCSCGKQPQPTYVLKLGTGQERNLRIYLDPLPRNNRNI